MLGAGIAGLAAARVLADRFAQVMVVDRDRLAEGTERRRGAPQGRHTRALLGKGGIVMEELFPGLTEDMVAAGAEFADINECALLQQAPSDCCG